MQGFILKITQAKNEDLIVQILTPKRLYTLYRFYGARHSPINLGYKIDFTIQSQIGYMDRLRNVTHLGYPWLKERQKLLLWQRFVKALYSHLKEIVTLTPFYYELLEDLAKKITRQDPKRAFIEGYVKLLEYEGRLHTEPRCFVCGQPIVADPAITRSYLLAHKECIGRESITKKHLFYLFYYKDAQYLEANEVDELFELLSQGF